MRSRLPRLPMIGSAHRLQDDTCLVEGATSPAAAVGPGVAGGVAAGVAGGVATTPASLTRLMSGHVLRDGEAIVLVLKPSLWSIPLEVLRSVAVALIVVIACAVWVHQPRYYVEAAVFLVIARTAWAMVNWMGQLYVLTDQRILRMAGVFSLEIDDCPLRKVVRARLLVTLRERLLRIGSIEIIPHDETRPIWSWQWVGQPRKVHEQVLRAIRRAKQGSSCFR